MSDRKRPTNIGGQAVIEGVMMRGKKIYAMAVRNPEGEIVVEKKPVGGLGKKGLFRYPIFRGMAAFVDSLVTATKIPKRVVCGSFTSLAQRYSAHRPPWRMQS